MLCLPYTLVAAQPQMIVMGGNIMSLPMVTFRIVVLQHSLLLLNKLGITLPLISVLLERLWKLSVMRHSYIQL